MRSERWWEKLIRITFVDDPYLVLILLPKKQPEALRFLAKAPLGERVSEKHKVWHFVCDR